MFSVQLKLVLNGRKNQKKTNKKESWVKQTALMLQNGIFYMMTLGDGKIHRIQVWISYENL